MHNGNATLAVRMRTRSRRKSLDRELARGADPGSGPELSLRAAQLTSPDGRRNLANALVAAVGQARAPNLGRFRTKLRRTDAVIRESADDVLALARRLRGDQPITVRGAALTARLLHDRSSPLRGESGPQLQHAARAALVALDAPSEGVHELPVAV